MEPVLQALDHFKIAVDLSGGQARIVCPFHDDAAPSLDIHLERGYWNCLGCGAHGDLVAFIGRMLSKNGKPDRLGALRLLSKLERQPTPDLQALGYRGHKETNPTDVVRAWRNFNPVNWHNVTLKNPVAQYLLERRRFKRSTLAAMSVRTTDMPDYPLVIPILQGRKMVGYVYRAIDGRTKNKYRYNAGFQGDAAMAYHRHTAEPLLVVEGMMDYMRVVEFGYGHAAAILSWKIKPQQAQWLKRRGIRTVICALDNDEPGRKGCAELARHFAVRAFVYPKGRKDPAELTLREFHNGLVLATRTMKRRNQTWRRGQ